MHKPLPAVRARARAMVKWLLLELANGQFEVHPSLFVDRTPVDAIA